MLMKNLFFLFLALSCSASAQTALDSDCATSSFTLTDFSSKAFSATKSAGLLPNEANGAACFNSAGDVEYNSLWLKWICAESGTLTFTITPDVSADDIDFIVYEISNTNTCSTKKILRCMATGTSPGICEILGETGLREGSTDIAEQSGCSVLQDNFLKPLDMKEGLSYTLMINNFSSNKSGIKIDFGGTGKFAPKVLQNKDFSNEMQAKIFPSPSASPSFTFTYNSENEEKNTLELFNICGQSVYQQSNIAPNTNIELAENTPSGMYFVRFTANEKTTMLKWELVK
jgi:hypothetical protein